MRAAYPNQLDYAEGTSVSTGTCELVTILREYHGGVAQMVERLLSMQEAQGSIPCSSTFLLTPCQQQTIYVFLQSRGESENGPDPSCRSNLHAHSVIHRQQGGPLRLGRGQVSRIGLSFQRSSMTSLAGGKKDPCLDRGSNTGPLDLQSNALPTELSKHLHCKVLIASYTLWLEITH